LPPNHLGRERLMSESAATCTTENVSSFYVAYTSQVSLLA
jgi:hypothetical protein